jgi:nucleotide-binding universal stress UspA family protein
MIRKILVAFDGSDPSRKAYDLALELAAQFKADLRMLAVARPPEPAEDVETEALLESAQEHYEALFGGLRLQATRSGVTPRFEVRVGHPADQIMSQAEAEDVDLIVMGHRGKSFIRHWIMGSVSKQVMNHAHCAVTVVR